VRAGLLIASPQLKMTPFERAVILLCRDDETGTMGLVINRPTSYTLDVVLSQLKIDHTKEMDDPVLWGGPVMQGVGFLVYQGDDNDALYATIEVSDKVRISSSQLLLERAAMGILEGPYYLCLGYSGWEPGQLDGEIRRGTWLYADLDPSLVFDVPLDERWDRAIALLGLDPNQLFMFNPIEE